MHKYRKEANTLQNVNESRGIAQNPSRTKTCLSIQNNFKQKNPKQTEQQNVDQKGPNVWFTRTEQKQEQNWDQEEKSLKDTYSKGMNK